MYIIADYSLLPWFINALTHLHIHILTFNFVLNTWPKRQIMYVCIYTHMQTNTIVNFGHYIYTYILSREWGCYIKHFIYSLKCWGWTICTYDWSHIHTCSFILPTWHSLLLCHVYPHSHFPTGHQNYLPLLQYKQHTYSKYPSDITDCILYVICKAPKEQLTQSCLPHLIGKLTPTYQNVTVASVSEWVVT